MSGPAKTIHWGNVLTVVSAVILMGTEVLGGALAGGWALAALFKLGDIGAYVLMGVFGVLGLWVIAVFFRNAVKVEPFRA